MDRLFLDANILFSAAYSANAGLLQFWKLRSVVLCSSRYALEEAAINLAQDIQKRRLEKLAVAIEFFEPISHALPQNLILPEKDVPILLAALSARATHLITGDEGSASRCAACSRSRRPSLAFCRFDLLAFVLLFMETIS